MQGVSRARAMNECVDSFERRLEHAKLEALKELAYGASHEINNPLANISARAQTLLRDERDPERRRALEAIHQQALRAHEMISDLMLFARPPRLEVRPCDTAALARQVLAEVADDCARRNIVTSLVIESAPPEIDGDPVQLAVALKALVLNAMEAIGADGAIQVTVQAFEAAEGDADSGESPFHGVRIEVRDDGPGIDPAARPHLFEPFFSGREAGRGLGFGLPKAWRIVTLHGGRIEAAPAADRGAAFVIELPRSVDRR